MSGPARLQAVVEETVELLRASLATPVRLETRLEDGDAAIVGDTIQLHRLVMNLCTNALQAMQSGGVLRITLDRLQVEQNCRVSHGSLSRNLYLRLCVADTGVGIPRDVLDLMFDPFFIPKPLHPGTGMGLSRLRGIVADLGGTIDVRTSVSRGTAFTIWLPVSEAAPTFWSHC
jgi:signal transduction histidine kinase